MDRLTKTLEAILALPDDGNCLYQFDRENPRWTDETHICSVAELKALATAGEWVPCSERLPEAKDRTTYFVTFADNEIGAKTGSPTFENGEWQVIASVPLKVIAWMPLPDPYRPKEEL